ncbi:uncharacterized protein EI97DRAFT_314308 [Westerdykella ornata]|uniref:Uncharacterized protein n=1 Tax=Westerdykella ornata TaxID=318751 RepID=A0A6A6JL71_WESOR|nr:uncharacterized protein EI97DRAFT_314308 [Westerdykella ornata]KAF2277242.1 hypothetical protein EI97DRAFT_314308 [Westerdykella ornata]
MFTYKTVCIASESRFDLQCLGDLKKLKVCLRCRALRPPTVPWWGFTCQILYTFYSAAYRKRLLDGWIRRWWPRGSVLYQGGLSGCRHLGEGRAREGMGMEDCTLAYGIGCLLLSRICIPTNSSIKWALLGISMDGLRFCFCFLSWQISGGGEGIPRSVVTALSAMRRPPLFHNRLCHNKSR